MTTSKFLAVLSLICIMFTIILGAQTKKDTPITGKVIDAQTFRPIPHVEVFVSGTMVGCITDSLGNFSLKAPFFPCVLVADHVSYQPFIKPLPSVQFLEIELSPSNYSIQEVSVKGKNKRKKNLRFFYSRFIPENRSSIKIQNDSVLVFYRDEMQFTAQSKEPLIIENYHLGYRIRVVLEEFKVIACDGPNGKQIPLNSINGGEVKNLSGYYFYETLENDFPQKKDSYIENRREMYYGSYRHFLKSIYDNNPEEHGYEILTPSGYPEKPLFQYYDILPEEKYKQFVITADTLNITYHFDDKKYPIPKEKVEGRYYLYTRKSTIYATRSPFVIRENGTSPNLTFIIDGLMAIKSFANSLPDDYIPPIK